MPTSKVSSQGLEIRYRVEGDGPAIVLLHSFLCSGAMWEPQVAALTERHRVVNVDLRGHGGSSPIQRPFTLYDMVADATAVLDHLAIERATWAGLSIGGMIALRAALRVPARVSRLILLDTDAGAETAWIRTKYRALGWIARRFGLGPVMPQVRRQMFGSTTLRERQDLVAAWTERFRSVDLPSVLITLDALVTRDDLTGDLGRIDVPALVVVGREDVSLPPRRSRVLADRLTAAELVEIDDAGHLSTLEQPEAVTAAMLRFLERQH